MICVYLHPTKAARLEAQKLPVMSVTTLLRNEAVQHCISLVDPMQIKVKKDLFFRQVCEVSKVAYQC